MADDGNNTLSFSGNIQHLTITLVNAYSGYTIHIDEEKNVNNASYDGMGGVDYLNMTSFGDALFIDDGNGNQLIRNVEVIVAGNGDDIINLSSTMFFLASGVTIIGGNGDDILWGNVGNDIINGSAGNDIIDGGPGDDILSGGVGDDYIAGGDGDDILDGGTGNDILIGGNGNDTYRYNTSENFGNDIIIENASSDTDTIQFLNNIYQSTLTYSFQGNHLLITAGSYGSIMIFDQFKGDGSGIDQIIFADNTVFDLRSVQPPNDDPAAQDDYFSGDEDEVITGNVLANDSDANGDVLNVVAGIFTTAGGGTVELLASGDFTYTPAVNYHGTDSFIYSVEDGKGGSDSAEVTLEIASVNDAPVAVNDKFFGNEDEVITGNVLANDTDVDGDVLSVEAGTFTTAAGGTIEFSANGDFTYTPAENYYGSDYFYYTVDDGNGGSATAKLSLHLEAVNDAPVAQEDYFSGNEDEIITGNVLTNDSDVDGDVLNVVAGIFTTAGGGTVELLASGDFIYTPAPDYYGVDSFIYTIGDGNGGFDTAIVTLDIADVIDIVTTNLDIRVSNANTATKYINSTDGYDITTASGYGVTETLNAATMDVAGVGANTKVSYSFADEGTATVQVDSAWNSMKNVEVSSDTAGNITLHNFVHADVSFGHGGDSSITITDAKRGFIETGDGNDTVTIEALTNNQHWSNVFDIKTGAGNDTIDFTGDKGITEVVIDAGTGDDVVTLQGNYKASTVYLGEGDDTAIGGNGADVIYGGDGNDHLIGGAGDDILYGGNNTALSYVDKAFNDDVLFPKLQERKSIWNMNPAGTASLGVKDPNLSVDFEASATLTFRQGYASYNNSLGIYSIAEDGTIQMASLLWENVKDAGLNVAHQIDIPAAGGFGFFIVSDGNSVNGGYNGLDTATAGNLRFVYDYGGANERAATVHDNGKKISLVYDDGGVEKVLKGYVYHTTERGDDGSLNPDGKVHAVSGLADANNPDVLKIGFEDLYKLGDADFEDVLFEININPVVIDLSDQGNDILEGGAGNDILYGEGGDDILIGGDGYDTLYGGTGADTFVFDSFVGYDTVKDFSFAEGDRLDISQILTGYSAGDNLDNFISFVVNGANTVLSVNSDGQGNDFVKVAVIEGVKITQGLEALVDDGALIVGQNAVI